MRLGLDEKFVEFIKYKYKTKPCNARNLSNDLC